MARRFIPIKPLDVAGEKPDRPSDEVLWEDLENVWFDKGVMRKRPALVAPTLWTAKAAGATASPTHVIVQYEHAVALDSETTEYPDGAGNYAEWTAVPATNNYQRVDDQFTVDSDYVETSTTGATEKDSYSFSDTSLVVVDKLIFNIRARRSTVDNYTLTVFCRTGTTDKDIGSITVVQAPGDNAIWEDYTLESDTNPQTSAAWTAANFNSYEFGFYPTFTTTAVTEDVAPDGDGTDDAWDIYDGAVYNSVLDPDGVETDWDNYIYTDDDSESFAVTFTPTNSFATITSITPRVWGSFLYGQRAVAVHADDGADDFLIAYYPVQPVSEDLADYDEYIADSPTPQLLDWKAGKASSGESLNEYDPITGVAWDNASAFTYDYNIKTTADSRSLHLRKKTGPSAFTTVTDWAMRYETDFMFGGGSSTNLSGTLRGNVQAEGDAYKAVVQGSLGGTFSGIVSTDNFTNLTDTSISGSIWVRGTLYSTTATGTFTGTVGAYTRGHHGGTLEDASGNQVFVTDESASCLVSIADATSNGVTVTATVSGASGSISYTDGYEHIVDSTLWKTDWISQDPVSDETSDIYKAQLFRNSSFAGDYPLVLASTDLPDLDYKDITRSALTMRAKYSINVDSSQHVFSLTTTASDGLLFLNANTSNFDRDKYFTGFTTGSWTEAEINADTIKMTDGDDSPHASDYMSIAAIRHVVDFHAYPEARIYKFQLRVVGTAGPKPGVSQFNITVDGATGTGKRTSKLVVSQTDFQRADAATLVDVLSVASGTAPTAGMTQRWDTCKFFGKQYFTNGIDTPYEYPDASNEVIDLTGSPPDGFTCASYAGRLFFGCTTETGTVFPDRVRWSAVEGATTWTGAGTGYIDLNDTDGRVVKLLPLGGILVAYKENSLYNLHATGDASDPIVKQLISPGIGAVAMGTVLSVVARDGLPAHIFLGQGRGGYNVYMYTGNLLTPIGDDIKEELRDNLNASQAKNAFAIVDQKRNQYMFFVAYAGETFPHRCWLYDIDTGAWKHWKTGEITCAGHLKGTETDDDIEEWFMYFGLNNSLSRWPDPDLNADEDSVNVRMTAESGDWAVERHKYATLYRLHIHYYDKGFTPLEVYTSNDGGDTWSDKVTVWIGQSDGSADDSLRVAYADLMETGKRFRMRVVHDADAAIKISELIMEVEEQGWIY